MPGSVPVPSSVDLFAPTSYSTSCVSVLDSKGTEVQYFVQYCMVHNVRRYVGFKEHKLHTTAKMEPALEVSQPLTQTISRSLDFASTPSCLYGVRRMRIAIQ